MAAVENFKTDAGFLKEAMGRLGDLFKMDGKNRTEALEKANLQGLLGVMKAHTKKADLMELVFACLRAILDDPSNDIAMAAQQQANAKTREIANKMGVTKQVTKYAADNAAAPAKQRSLGLLTEGIALLIVLAPPEGDLDPKAGDAVLATMLADGKDLNLQQLGLVYFAHALSSNSCSESDLTKRQGHCTGWHLVEAIVEIAERFGKDYALHHLGVQIIRFITAGSDTKVNERGQTAAQQGALKLLIGAIKAFPKPEKPEKRRVEKGKRTLGDGIHLVDHAIAAIRNITACSDELGRQAREAGAQSTWVAKAHK